MAGIRIEGNTSGNVVEVTGSNQLKVITETDVTNNPQNVGAVRFFSENDPGSQLGTPYLYSPETDEDYRLRVAIDNMLDSETFNYSAQNTGKHNYQTTTVTATWNPNGLTTNGGSSVAAGGATVQTYAEFPIFGANVLYAEFEASITTQCPANAIVDFGMFRKGGTQPFAPTDGIFFRLTSAGLQGVTNYNASETTTNLFDFTFVLNQKYQFIITINQRAVQFWVDEVLYGEITTPVGVSQPCLSATLPICIRHGHTNTTSVAMQFVLSNYNLSIGGITLNRTLGEIGNSMLGSYQGLSGGTMGSLSIYSNNSNPSAAVPSNTALTANLVAGLGGQAWENFTTGLAANTDGILLSYQVPAGSTAVQGKRLKVTGVKLSAFIQTALTGGGFNSTFTLSFGGTNVNLTTAEAAGAKARRIALLPELTQAVTSGQAINTMVSQPGGAVSNFDQPIYVNPSEFVQVVVKHIGTVATAGVIAYNIQLVYSWE
jgi:hypothetical protein